MKATKSVMLPTELIAQIEQSTSGSFSAKVEALLIEALKSSTELIKYNSDNELILVNNDAELIYAISEDLKGFSDSELADEAKNIYRKYHAFDGVNKKIFPLLQKVLQQSGWIVQIYEDQNKTELWAVIRTDKCKACKQNMLFLIQEAINV